MDTRTKIVSPAEAAGRMAAWSQSGESVEIVLGCFDPLLAVHAGQLERVCTPGARVAVFLEEGREPILPAAVRAELVAALRKVDLVVTAADSIPAGFPVHDFTAGDETSRARFIEHVHQRNQAGQ